jgi:hypothetical protein
MRFAQLDWAELYIFSCTGQKISRPIFHMDGLKLPACGDAGGPRQQKQSGAFHSGSNTTRASGSPRHASSSSRPRTAATLPATPHRHRPPPALTSKPRLRPISTRSRVRASNSDSDSSQQQQVNLSVLRFTLGITPSLLLPPLTRMDSGTGRLVSYLPRWLGICFGALVLLNHFVSSSPTPAQLVGPRQSQAPLAAPPFSL